HYSALRGARGFTKLYVRDIGEQTPGPRLQCAGNRACAQIGVQMADPSITQPGNPDPTYRRTSRGAFVVALVAVALLAGLTGNMLSTAFGQGFAWHHFGMRDGGMFGAPLTPAQIDDRIDRMTKHMAIELDATTDQQAKIAGIAKAAVGDLRT